MPRCRTSPCRRPAAAAWSLKDAAGTKLVLYFYPRDNTPGCTLEARTSRDLHAALRARPAPRSSASRATASPRTRNSATRWRCPFPLLSDEDEKVCKLFDVIREKNMYGRKYLGIERSTFLLDAAGVLRQEWRKVKVARSRAQQCSKQRRRCEAPPSRTRRLFVLDTNVLMHDPTAIFRFEEHDIYLPMVVLEELDANKKGLSEASRNVRQVSRFLDDMMRDVTKEQIDAGPGASRPATTGNHGKKPSSGRLFFQTRAARRAACRRACRASASTT